MKQLRFLALGAAILTLGACETMNGFMEDVSSLNLSSLTNQQPRAEKFVASAGCPEAKVVNELGVLNEFTDSTSPQESNMISHVEITNLSSSCAFSEKSMTVDLNMTFDGKLGPKGRVKSGDMPFFSYPFFVAVTSSGGDILAKEVFAASITYDDGQSSQTYHENLRQVIPIASKSRGGRYKVLVGFQLDEHQLAYNRGVTAAQQEAAKVAPAAGSTTMPERTASKPSITAPAPQKVQLEEPGPAKQKPVPIDLTAP